MKEKQTPKENNTAIKIYTLHFDGTETLRKVIPNKKKRSKETCNDRD